MVVLSVILIVTVFPFHRDEGPQRICLENAIPQIKQSEKVVAKIREPIGTVYLVEGGLIEECQSPQSSGPQQPRSTVTQASCALSLTACLEGLAPFAPPRHSSQNTSRQFCHCPKPLRSERSPLPKYLDPASGMVLLEFSTRPYSSQSSPTPTQVYRKVRFPSRSCPHLQCLQHLVTDWIPAHSASMIPICRPSMQHLQICPRFLE